ncbi:LysR family substrate-binding domain-containing protein [Catellatospora bangladeshensis]|uniref:LysR family substrate-binding domain-containing protein n=1 Tax=Catellatospora bangladeshensis TaxID=310355 RepID=UPI00360C4979
MTCPTCSVWWSCPASPPTSGPASGRNGCRTSRWSWCATAADAAALLREQADAGLVRLPVDPEACHAIPLYTETTVVVVHREHLLAAADEVTVAELADETVVWPLDDVLGWPGTPAAPAPVAEYRPETTAEAVELVAASVGVLLVPQSLARAHHRRDLTYRVVTDAPTASIGLAWDRDRHTDLVEEMIGIVRGRTANSTRGRGPAPADKPAAAKAPVKAAGRATPGRDGGRRGAAAPHPGQEAARPLTTAQPRPTPVSR